MAKKSVLPWATRLSGHIIVQIFSTRSLRISRHKAVLIELFIFLIPALGSAAAFIQKPDPAINRVATFPPPFPGP